ncbi:MULTISPECIES: phosphate/phosphite/phosphonate ABC transporter substrate-binding protein [Rhizobium]|uniref:PhnD/SsuA/transferrin family substrate-binding protein n=1 Tax=Rhizobium rhododendri TaxID=2506430 RepID=A0ABY8III5_9HYPH|nr:MULTISPECIES: PhnD/SsuA/transferrin family substrate-binding protein [Rhizobium]MBZ5759735.1 PhnD/SsuA/transferrin family substrate-binding protein [Rhizobium sp. VS19-DR96]MBZ5766123.1 PhnD/SsuA/transferrin family substrate-binding protein [Rhizobium sp. VS19-DR129.2]MBZ5772906.1 PhnD/SsuA/transferrin family substrate-binding protein [Rhizobium sp. VS19-DRK62.2]MBZ5783890.1 PhnD/SsuA/transferrin family substrate-binding protein [Rhizobium sp. VS19-DR121]MBZ5803467.1 PhnD/SsuA/transferrin f
MRLASLAMYTTPAPVAAANDALWVYLRNRLRQLGLDGVPDDLDRLVVYDQAWLRPDLLVAQTCGFPFVTKLLGRVRLLATPVYDLPGCNGPLNRSKIIVAGTSPATGLEDLRGLTAAINEPGSNSGSNLFRAAIAPLARDGRFFGSVIETGGHLASIEAVASGKADVAAIDCVTFGNTLRFDPDRLANVRILAETPEGPGLPFITSIRTTDDEIAAIRLVLDEVALATELVEVREVLSLRRFEVLPESAYQRLAELARDAASLGYPVIA